MKKLLIIPAPIKSHIIPSFPLATKLKKDFEVYFLINQIEFEKMILENGFHSIYDDSFRYGEGFSIINVWNETKAFSFFKRNILRIKSLFSQDEFQQRNRTICNCMKEYDFDYFLIDIFSITDFYLLYPFLKGKKIASFNPMLNVFKDNIRKNQLKKTKSKNIFFDFRSLIIQIDIFIKLKFVYKTFQIPGNYHRGFHDGSLIPMINHLPEIILAPIELEFSPDIKIRDQFYFGLDAIQLKNELNKSDEEIIHLINSDINKHRKIIYVSFGTYYQLLGEYQEILNFIKRLIYEFKNNPEVIFIVSLKKELVQLLNDNLIGLNNFHFFDYVNQLYLLKRVDLFITHGGLGSLKEAILCTTPILTIPLDLNWDQPSNALRVNFHQIGLTANIFDNSFSIKTKIEKILSDKSFKSRLIVFNENISKNKDYSNFDWKEIFKLID